MVADTLAAAFAENGEFEAAVETQRWVVQEGPNQLKQELRQRLKLYLERQAYRQEETE